MLRRLINCRIIIIIIILYNSHTVTDQPFRLELHERQSRTELTEKRFQEWKTARTLRRVLRLAGSLYAPRNTVASLPPHDWSVQYTDTST